MVPIVFPSDPGKTESDGRDATQGVAPHAHRDVVGAHNYSGDLSQPCIHEHQFIEQSCQRCPRIRRSELVQKELSLRFNSAPVEVHVPQKYIHGKYRCAKNLNFRLYWVRKTAAQAIVGFVVSQAQRPKSRETSAPQQLASYTPTFL